MIRVAVAGASDVARAGIAALASSVDGIDVVGRSSDPDELAQLIASAAPDVVLVDVDPNGDDDASRWLLPLGDGLQSPAIVVLSDEPADGRPFRRHGAWASLPRRAGVAEVDAAIRAVVAGLVVMHPDALEQPAAVRGGIDGAVLTPREMEVLSMLAAGLPNKSIAKKLGVSAHTVKFHVGSIMAKLHASSRTEAVTDGIRRGLIFL